MSIQQNWWKVGVRFECQGSGKCCTSHGEYGFVFLTLEDRRRMAKHLGLSTSAFTRKHCDNTNGAFHLKEDSKNPNCMFLEGKACGVYEARPTQCRTWPFWPDVMNAKTWKKEVIGFCPGIGKGKLYSGAEIEKILNEQAESEESLTTDKRI